MPTHSEMLRAEHSPRESAAALRTVRLSRSGTFLRAYDWSAWLLLRSGSSLNANLDRVDGASHIFVGFPVSSADKFAPEGSEAVKDGDGVPTEWILPPTKFPPEDLYPMLDDDYARWQSGTLAELETEKAERKRRKETEKNATAKGRGAREDDTADWIEDVSASPLRLTDVARQILRFPLDRRSPEECVSFIRRIQTELLDLL